MLSRISCFTTILYDQISEKMIRQRIQNRKNTRVFSLISQDSGVLFWKSMKS
jgi:hypothetical protein